jgi:hypothetical protein
MAERLSAHRKSVRVDTEGSTGLKLLGAHEHAPGEEGPVAVNEDCRHYVMQTTARGDKLERCKIGANEPLPFACPEGCVFYEPRKVSSAGWQVPRDDKDR